MTIYSKFLALSGKFIHYEIEGSEDGKEFRYKCEGWTWAKLIFRDDKVEVLHNLPTPMIPDLAELVYFIFKDIQCRMERHAKNNTKD